MLELSPTVIRIAEAEGLALGDIVDMVAKSALVKHSRGNRRFHDWVFDVKPGATGPSVVAMSKFRSPVVLTRKKDYPVLFEVCPACDSDTCKECGWTGELEVVYQP